MLRIGGVDIRCYCGRWLVSDGEQRCSATAAKRSKLIKPRTYPRRNDVLKKNRCRNGIVGDMVGVQDREEGGRRMRFGMR